MADKSSTTSTTRPAEAPLGATEMRLNARQWLLACGIAAVVLLGTPKLWEKLERFETGPDYRLPYTLSQDYWLYGRRLRQVADPAHVVVLGDSVVWGEYVQPEGTLSHFLNRVTGETNRFVNAGVNGFFPLALEGLIRYHGQALRHQKVILQCNVLWMTSAKADLSTDKEEPFNHSRLVPQWNPRIPCYKAGANERLSAAIERHVDFLAWVGHLQNAYFGQKSIPGWTLEDAGGNPPRYPNAYKNPLSQITWVVPSPPREDPQRGPQSSRHKPWTSGSDGLTHFDWVDLKASLQWQAFQRVVEMLQTRGNDVLVVLGPFNEHMLAEENRPVYRKMREDIAAWLMAKRIPCVVPETLPSSLYADASHPLTQGYEMLAGKLVAAPAFRTWLKGP